MDVSGSRREDPGPMVTPTVTTTPVVAGTFGRIPCPVCGFPIGAVKGSKSAVCENCGFKDGCC